jgi:uncharacterized glyoxalase superfamily protein PhnB
MSSDPFDVLRIDDAPLAPRADFAADLRDQLITELEEPMTIAGTAPDLSVANTITPYLCVDGAAAAIDFYVAVFGAVEHHRMVGDDGRIGHAEIVVGGSRLMLADEYPEAGVLSPTTRGGTSTNFTITVADCDAVVARALAAGATLLRPVEDQFYGHRQGTIVDPFGHQWSISTPIAGFDDQQYDANSAEAGFKVKRTQAAGDDEDINPQQLKHHGLGDLYYFTLPTTDLARAHAFFGAVLGWQFDDPTAGHIGNIAAPPGALGTDAAHTVLYFVVADIHAAVARVRALGGTATEPVMYDSGWNADCIDDQGTAFSLSVPAEKYTL